MKKLVLAVSIAASLATVSASAFAATSTNVNNIQSTSRISVSSNQGIIEHLKKTISNADGSIAAVDETWNNSITHERKFMYKESDGVTSICTVGNNCTKYSKITKDANGNIIGRNSIDDYKITDGDKKDLFTTDKEEYKTSKWVDEGIVKNQDGKDLRKLSYISSSDVLESESQYKEVVFLDDTTGLPAKGEIYKGKKGKNESMNLIYIITYEYGYVNDDSNLFNIN